MNGNNKQSLSLAPVDHITSVVKGAVGVIPVAGPLLAEIAGTLIPNQRIDRLVKFAEQLGSRLSDIEADKLREHLTDENFTDAVEESMRQAARSTSDERRAYIASLLANGIKSDAIDFIETKHLLRLLNDINDIEVIWLRAYFSWHWGARDEHFMDLHKEILEPLAAVLGASQAQLDRAAMQQSYKLHLERLGLLRPKIRFDAKTQLPEFDRNDGFARVGFEITALGQLLIRHIDMMPTEPEGTIV